MKEVDDQEAYKENKCKEESFCCNLIKILAQFLLKFREIQIIKKGKEHKSLKH